MTVKSISGNSQDSAPIQTGSWLYHTYFEGTTKYEYDRRIDDYNWHLIFFSWLIFYFALQGFVRKYAPGPGPIKIYQEKKKMHDYHFFYFQYCTMLHALIGCIVSKNYPFAFINYRSLYPLLWWLPV